MSNSVRLKSEGGAGEAAVSPRLKTKAANAYGRNMIVSMIVSVLEKERDRQEEEEQHLYEIGPPE